ncbi:unnamed protein product [Parnassius apollo]|uniref:(apollo) hypothetical protein n=1 Tax=Parnassius apollo TaxID=110799 RepID=A0A8S3Y7X5_PARAO|nr:unnamed protein product [Parnassius apollo]
MLVTYLEASRDLCETDSILFGAALAVCRIIGAKVSTAGRATGHSSAIPAWRRRIEERIAKARALIGRLICFRSGNNRPRIVRTVRMAFAGTNVSLSQPDITQKLTERIDDLKQRIAAWGKRIRRYTERSTRFNQNRLFQSDQKRLYESLERPMVSGTGPAPNRADTVAFWRGLWSEPVNHSEGPWTEVVASQCAGITPMDPVIITPDDVAEAVRRAPNWKSPGLDGLHHYWLKGFMELEIEQMRSTLEEAILETRSTPLENRPRLPRIPLSKRNRAVVRALNPMLVTYLEASRDLCETDSILFGAALAVCRIIGAKLPTAGRATGQSSAIPAWRTRIEERIAKARALIGRLICFRSGNNRPRIVRTVRMAFAGTNISLSQPDITQKLTERIDDLKQRIAAWGKRIRRYTERSTRFNQNRLFQSDQKRLYKSLERPKVSGTGPVPNQADTVAFWRSLWSEPVNHSEGPWTEVVASQCAGIRSMNPVIITPDDVAEAVRRAPNWKSPGLDGLHHYWLKGFVVCHAVLARQFQEALNQKSLPSLFTTGITHLVPKDQENKFSSFSDKRTKQWVCPECACSKPKRYDPNTPIRDTPDLKTFTPSANVNTQRGSRMQLMDESIVECDNNSNDKLLSEFRKLKYEVLSRLDVQTNIIKHLQEICFSTKTELEELRIKMKVFQNKLFPTDLLSTQNQQFESIDSITESLNTGLEMSKQIDVPYTFADVARMSLNNVNKTNVTPCVIKTPAAMKIATGRGSVVQTQPINQPQCVTPRKELNINISEEEEKN